MKPFFTPFPNRRMQRAFTIVELLVVMAVITILVGVLLPAITKALHQAKVTQSKSNIRQIGTSINTYAAEFADRQPTFVFDNISTWGNLTPNSCEDAFENWNAFHGYPANETRPWLVLGMTNAPGTSLPIGIFLNHAHCTPMSFCPGSGFGFGSFRIPNAAAINTYLNGRFYDEVYYAPNDAAVMNSVEKWLDTPSGYTFSTLANPIADAKWSSYCLSPAAMFNPAVFAKNANGDFFTDPWVLPTGFKSPGLSQAAYSNLKTQIMEHHWIQGRKKPCHPSITGDSYDGCNPYYFNASVNSAPVTLYYDGHVDLIGVQDALLANKQVVAQNQSLNHGLWSKDTPMGGSFEDGGTGGYFSDYAYDFASTSFHIFTIDGIKGRDITSK